MARRRKRTKNKISYNNLHKLLMRHGKVKIVIRESDRRRSLYGERILFSNGGCVVRYPKYGNDLFLSRRAREEPTGFSRYRTSCFREDWDTSIRVVSDRKSKTELMLAAMKEHDGSWLHIAEVYVGRNFNKRVR